MKEFLLHHAEKLALGLCVALAGWFLVDALTAKGYERTPEQFGAVIQNARTNVEKAMPEGAIADLKPLDFQKLHSKLYEGLDPSSYGIRNPFIKPYELRYSFRDQPAILAPTNVAARANGGLFVLQPKKGGANVKVFQTLWTDNRRPEAIWFFGNDDMKEELGIIESKKPEDATRRPAAAPRDANREEPRDIAKKAVSRFWVEIVADFPHAEQLWEFHRALREGVSDVGLRYALVEVQRRELDGTLAWTEWKPIDWSKQFDIWETAEAMQKPEDEFSWGVVRGLVMQTPKRAIAAEGTSDAKPIWVQMRESLSSDAFVDKREPDWTQTLGTVKETPAVSVETQEPREIVTIESQADKQKSPAGGFDNFDDVYRAGLRVWDATVQPARRYEYRIRVVAFNPNYNRPDVVDPSYAVPMFLEGPWSDPVEVYVEPAVQWYVDKTDSMKRNEVKVTIFHWMNAMGAYVPVEILQQQAGQVIGWSRAGRPAKFASYDPASGRMVVKEGNVEASQMDTKEVLLSVTPGRIERTLDGIDRKIVLRPPKEVIVVNEYGDLVRRSEVADSTGENPVRAERQGRYEFLLEQISKVKGTGGRQPLRPRETDDSGLKYPLKPD